VVPPAGSLSVSDNSGHRPSLLPRESNPSCGCSRVASVAGSRDEAATLRVAVLPTQSRVNVVRVVPLRGPRERTIQIVA
jgi:hypothetical protein